jgi:glycyl-tRNA synthetase
MCLPLFSQEKQLALEDPITDLTLEKAVENSTISNEILGYFMARTYLFFQLCGIPADNIRFRQHLKTEMAHYACDCLLAIFSKNLQLSIPKLILDST